MDKAKVIDAHRKAVDRLCRGREAVLRNAYENALFWLDAQWIRWSGAEQTFLRANVAKGSPRPVENLFKPKLMKAISRLSATEPSLTFAPGSENDDDRVTADNGRLVLRYIEDVVRMDALRNSLAYQTALFGNAWLIGGYDPDGGPMVDVGGKQEPQGEITAEVASIFEVLCDYTIPQMRRQPVLIWRKMRTLEWAYEHYPSSETATRREGDSNSASSDLGLTMIQNIIRLQPTLFSVIGSSAQYARSVVVDDMYMLPCRDFPDGLLARIVNDGEEVLEAKPLPFHDGTTDQKGRVFIPATHFGYDEVPGALLCTTPANSLKEPQRQRNRLIAHILLYFARTANGVWAIPENADVSTMNGTEGIVIRFTANSTGGGEPRRIEGGSLPNSFAERLVQIEKVMDDIITVGDLADKFPRADSAVFINTVIEQQQQQLGPVFKRWGESWAQAAKSLFYIFRNFAPEEVYYAIKGEEARWSFKKIAQAELRGGVDIRIEAGSLMPKTLLQRRAAYEQMASLHIVDLTDPDVQLKYARAIGAVELMEGLEADDNQIAREHDALIEWAKQFFDLDTGQLLPGVDPNDPALTLPIHVDPDFDNQQLHIQRHREFCLSEQFQALPLSVQEAFRTYHYRVHVQLAQQAQQNQMMQQAQVQAMAKGGPQGGPGGQPKNGPVNPENPAEGGGPSDEGNVTDRAEKRMHRKVA